MEEGGRLGQAVRIRYTDSQQGAGEFYIYHHMFCSQTSYMVG